MKFKQLIVLLAILAALLVWVIFSNRSSENATAAEVGKRLFEDLKTEDVRQISLNGGKEEVVLEVKDGKWGVRGRDGYPANFDNIHNLISKASQVTVLDVQDEVPDKYLGRYKLMKPGTGGKDDETGVLVSLKKEDGSAIKTFTVGKNAASSGNVMMGGGAGGQYVKVEGAEGKVHKLKDGFDYTINSVTNKDWLNKLDFFKPEKIKSVAVTSDKPENDWKLFREKEGSDSAELKLADVKPGEEFDTAKASTSGIAFASPSFNDVATEAQKAGSGLDKPERTAVIETFEGFTYTVKVGKKTEQKDPAAGGAEEYFVSVDVNGVFPETAPEWKMTPEDEKKTEEDKKSTRELMAKSFTDELARKKEKLAKEKALVSRVYLAPKFVVEPLLKNRSEFMKDKPAADAAQPVPGAEAATPPIMVPPAGAPPSAPVGGAGKGTGAAAPKRQPITATTPPVSVEIPAAKLDPKKPAEKKPAADKKEEVRPAEKAEETKPADKKEEAKPAEAPLSPAPPPAAEKPAAEPAPPAPPAEEKKP